MTSSSFLWAKIQNNTPRYKKGNGLKWSVNLGHLKPFEHIVFPLLYFLP